jgi:hypothetical protein
MSKENKNILVKLVIFSIFLFLVFCLVRIQVTRKSTIVDQKLNRLEQRIDSVSDHYSEKMKIYEEQTYVLDSIIKLSNEDYEEAVEHYWDSVANNTDDSTFNSELSDFLEDMANRRR